MSPSQTNTQWASIARPSLPRRLFSHVLTITVLSCLTWTLMHLLSYPALDGRHDMLENYAWSQLVGWGTHKHPPFFSWVVGLWFSWVTHQSTYYKLLAYLNVALALWGVFKLAQALDLPELGKPAVILLLWSLPYTTLAAKFNANSPLLSLWPWTAFCLLRSWQGQGGRSVFYTFALGALAAACMLSKYYSGIFLCSLLLVCLMRPQGRRWMRTPWPYFALGLMLVLLWPHIEWVLAHNGVTFKYVEEQGNGHLYYKGLLTFALSPILYWLPAWLVVVSMGGLALSRVQPVVPRWRVCLRWAGQSWAPEGFSDTLFGLAFWPWAISLVFGLSAFVNLSTSWAIPIGYAFPQLWLRNFQKQAQLKGASLSWSGLDIAIYPVLVALLTCAALLGWRNAQKTDANYYRPGVSVARTLLADWHERHPGTPLKWVGGDWAENAVLSFYGDAQLVAIPGLPESEAVRHYEVGDLRGQPGLIFCSLGPVPAERLGISACEAQAQAWLHSRGLPLETYTYRIYRKGWRFPARLEFEYVVFHVPSP